MAGDTCATSRFGEMLMLLAAVLGASGVELSRRLMSCGFVPIFLSPRASHMERRRGTFIDCRSRIEYASCSPRSAPPPSTTCSEMSMPLRIPTMVSSALSSSPSEKSPVALGLQLFTEPLERTSVLDPRTMNSGTGVDLRYNRAAPPIGDGERQ